MTLLCAVYLKFDLPKFAIFHAFYITGDSFPVLEVFLTEHWNSAKKARRQAVADYLETKNVMQLLLVAALVLIRSTTHSKASTRYLRYSCTKSCGAYPDMILTVYCTIQIMLPLRLFL